MIETVGPRQRSRLFRNIADLRRAELATPSADVARVRRDLEEELGGTVSRNLAAQLLGVSHTALNNWIDAGQIPVVISERGRKEVPVGPLLELYERVEGNQEERERIGHPIEAWVAEKQRSAEKMRPAQSAEYRDLAGEPHRRADLRALAYHRAVAPLLRRRTLAEAVEKVRAWREDGRVDDRYAQAWEELLAKPVHDVRRVISADDERGRDLRQNSPLAGLLSEAERRKILETVR